MNSPFPARARRCANLPVPYRQREVSISSTLVPLLVTACDGQWVQDEVYAEVVYPHLMAVSARIQTVCMLHLPSAASVVMTIFPDTSATGWDGRGPQQRSSIAFVTQYRLHASSHRALATPSFKRIHVAASNFLTRWSILEKVSFASRSKAASREETDGLLIPSFVHGAFRFGMVWWQLQRVMNWGDLANHHRGEVDC